MHFEQPKPRILFLTWAALMALTIATMFAGRVTLDVTLGTAFMTAVAAITWIKSILILRFYLNLAAATRGWNSAFSAFLAVLLMLIVMIYAISKFI